MRLVALGARGGGMMGPGGRGMHGSQMDPEKRQPMQDRIDTMQMMIEQMQPPANWLVFPPAHRLQVSPRSDPSSRAASERYAAAELEMCEDV